MPFPQVREVPAIITEILAEEPYSGVRIVLATFLAGVAGIEDHTMIMRPESTLDRSTRRRTDRCGSVCIGKPHPVCCKTVEVGCFDNIITITSDRILPLLVHKEKQNIFL